MVAFRTPVDIANRALQHCGASRIDPVLGFNEGSVNASEVASCYDKLREAELKRRIWTFATRRTVIRAIDDNTMLLAPALWVQGTTYFVGSIVSDQTGSHWISNIPNNTGNDPLLTTFWEPYFGPLSVSLYDSATAYYSGELVYTAAGNGTSRVYLSLHNDNTDAPSDATTYDPTVTYFKNQVVTFSSVAYMSLIDLNTGNEPDLTAPANWASGTTYSTGQKVNGSDGNTYASLSNGNTGNNPVTDNGVHWSKGGLTAWTTSFTGGTGSDKWLQIGGAEFPAGVALATLNIVYPLGSGPSTQSITRNVFHLPAGYLRMAPQTPKTGLNSLGGPSGATYNDWLIESGYLISSEVRPLTLRFIANLTDVSRMDTMFCEGLAARIGLEVCETITQSSAKLGTIAKIYDRWIREAGLVDAIEDGYEDPPDDDLITVRY